MMNGLDFTILLIYIIFIIKGFINGFFSTLLTLIVIAGSLFLSIQSPMLLKSVPMFNTGKDAMILTVISFFILLFFGLFLKHKFFKPLVDFKLFNALDKILGVFLGFVKSTLVVFGICYILMFFSNASFIQQSKFFPYIEKYSSTVFNYVQKNHN
jgi:uncharacterized membrane protein required for colicin V production